MRHAWYMEGSVLIPSALYVISIYIYVYIYIYIQPQPPLKKSYQVFKYAFSFHVCSYMFHHTGFQEYVGVILYYTILYYNIPYCVVLDCLYYTIGYCTTLTMPYYSILYDTLYYTILY